MATTTTTRHLNGAAVRVIRNAYGIRHGDLARRATISAPFLTRLETGERQASAPVQRALADALGVPLEAITYPAQASVTAAV